MNGQSTNALVGPLDTDDIIKSRIFTIRGVQVMLDSDLAVLYGVPTKRLNEQVKRNLERFPSDFMFQPTAGELSSLRSQFATSNAGRGGTRYIPYVFTGYGIIMLASILKSEVAVQASIRITHAFVAMRRALSSISPLINRIDMVECRQIADQQRNEERFDTIFKARMRPRLRRRVARARSASREAVARGRDGGEFPPQKVFFDGRHYEAYSFAKKLVGKATKSILLVDGYCDDVTLDILSAKRCGVKVTVATVEKTPITDTAIAKFNKQNPTLEVRHTGRFHDRFLVIDDKELYHFGASLKDLGRHYCAVSRMDAAFIPSILQRM